MSKEKKGISWWIWWGDGCWAQKIWMLCSIIIVFYSLSVLISGGKAWIKKEFHENDSVLKHKTKINVAVFVSAFISSIIGNVMLSVGCGNKFSEVHTARGDKIIKRETSWVLNLVLFFVASGIQVGIMIGIVKLVLGDEKIKPNDSLSSLRKVTIL